jgi:hypothetical protein
MRPKLVRFSILSLLIVPLMTGCGALGGGDVTVSGQVITTKVYSDKLTASYGLEAPQCGSMSVQIMDGSGEVLAVAKSETTSEDLSDPGSDVHTLTCTSEYSFEVGESDVYTVSLPKVSAESVQTATTEQTVNRDDSETVAVPDMDVMWKMDGF